MASFETREEVVRVVSIRTLGSVVFCVQLWDVIEGLRMAKRMGWRRVEVIVDSTRVVEVVEKGCNKRMEGFDLVKSIQDIMR